MTTQTIKDKVTQAIDRTWVLKAEIKTASEAVQKAQVAKAASQQGKSLKELESTQESATKGRQTAYTLIQLEYAASVEKADAALEVANKAHETVVVAADGTQGKLRQQAKDDYEKKIAQAQKAHENTLRVADAAVFEAQKQLNAKEDTFNQHRQVVRERLGFDVGTIPGD